MNQLQEGSSTAAPAVRVSVPDSTQIRAALERVVTSSTFVKSDRLCQFLRFVVESDLAGQSERLKETIVGVEVFDREPSYDPRAQPIVRTEARRLRSKLEHYYLTEGCDDPVAIEIPRGGYIPQFRFRPAGLAQPVLPDVPGPAALPDMPHSPAVAASRRLSPAAWLVASILLCGIAAVTWLYVSSRGRNQPTAQLITTLSALPGNQFHPSLSPDGNRLAFVWNGNGGTYNIYLKDSDQDTPRRLTTGKGQDLNPTWSPDGRSIAFLRATPDTKTILVIPSNGGPEREITQINPVSVPWVEEASTMRRTPGPAWSPDGQFLAVTDRCGNRAASDCIYLISIDGLQRTRITSGAPVGDYAPAFSPDGQRIAFLRMFADMNLAEIFIKPLSARPERRLTSDDAMIGSVAWSNTGRILFVSNREATSQLWSIPESGGEPQLVPGMGSRILSVAAAARVNRIVCAQDYRNVNIWRARLTGTDSQPALLIGSSRVNHSPQYSLDGNSIVFYSDRSGRPELWRAKADGSQLRRLTFFSGARRGNRLIGSPNSAPDGNHIVYDALETGRSQIYLMNADGSGQRQFTNDPGEAMMPTWSRDGRSIYYIARRQGANSLWKTPVGGGNPIQIAEDVATDALESPDGLRVFFSKATPGIWEAPANGGNATLIPELASVIDSRYCFVGQKGIYFLAQTKSPWEIRYFDLATRRISHLLDIPRTPEFFTRSLSISPNGNWLLYTQVDQAGSEIVMLTEGETPQGRQNAGL